MIDKSKLLADAAALRTDTVVIEGQTLTVREFAADAFAEYGAAADAGKKAQFAIAIKACVIDEEGNEVFTAEEAAVMARTTRTSMKIINKVMELSGFKEDTEKHSDAG